MELHLYQFIIVCTLTLLAGFVDSIAGGGGLISMPAYLLAGLEPILASGTNKLSAFMGGFVSLVNYYKKGFVRIKLAIPCCILSFISSIYGAKVQTMIPSNILKIAMLVALPITLIIILNKKSLEPDFDGIIEFGFVEYIKCMFISIILGFYDGIYGPGTGTFLIIFFVNVVHMNLKEANGLAKSINFCTNVGSLAYFLYSGNVIIILGIVAGVFNMIIQLIGSNLFAKKGVKIVRPIMIIVMIVFMIKISLELLHII